MGAVAAWLALLGYLSFLWPTGQRWWREGARRWGLWGLAWGMLPFLLAGFPLPDGRAGLRWALFLALPALLRHLGRRHTFWGTVGPALALWFALEPDLFLLPWGRPQAGFWVWFTAPEIHAPLGVLPLTLPLAKLTGVWTALCLFVAYRPLPKVGFTLHLSRQDGAQALLGWALFGLVGVPLGLLLGFLRWAPRLPGWGEAVLELVGGYLLVALPEELLFRGLLQNAFAQRWPRLGLPLGAMVFGLSHLNNATPGFPVPNSAYALMATLAGLAYGWVWQRTGKVTASALTHALVNAVWGWWFAG